jgi:hypothetical protein
VFVGPGAHRRRNGGHRALERFSDLPAEMVARGNPAVAVKPRRTAA